MVVMKIIHKDGSTIIRPVPVFDWDKDRPNRVRYIDQEGDWCNSSPDIVTVFVYSGPMVIFTRDLRTGQPVEGFHV